MNNNLFWKLTFILKEKYFLYWFIIGTINLILYEFFLTVYNEKHFIWTELFFSYFIFTGIPVLMIYGNHLLIKFREYISKEFTLKDGNLSSWISIEIRKIFDSRNYFSWSTALLVNLIGTITILVEGLPFDSIVTNILSIVAIQPVFFMCGWAAYFVASIMLFQYRLVRLKFSILFLEYYPRVISILSRLVYLFTLLVLIEYLGLFFAINYGPWGISLYMLPWLFGLAITPLLSFIWGIFQIHKLQLEIKLQHVDIITSEAQKMLSDYRTDQNLNTIGTLNNTIDIFFKIKQVKDWPISLQAIITFILAIAAAVGQILIVVSNFLDK